MDGAGDLEIGDTEDEVLPGSDRQPVRKRTRIVLALVAVAVVGAAGFAVVSGREDSERAGPTTRVGTTAAPDPRPCENTTIGGSRCSFYEPVPIAVLDAVQQAFPGASIRTSRSELDRSGRVRTRSLGIRVGSRQAFVEIAPADTGRILGINLPTGKGNWLVETGTIGELEVTIVVGAPERPADRAAANRLARDPRLLATY